MTGTGGGSPLDFLNEPDPVPNPVPAAETPIPSPLALPEGLELSESEEPSSSIFDDSPSAPVNSLDELPDAVPNISDGGTEILARGRSELQEFEEQFSAASPSKESSVPEFTDAPEPTVNQAPVPVEPESLLDGLFDSPVGGGDPATPPTVQDLGIAGSDTAVGQSPRIGPDGSTSGLNLELGPPDSSSASLTDSAAGLSLGSLAAESASLDDLNSAATSVPAAAARPRSSADSSNQRLLWIVLGGYAAIVTLLCMFLLVMLAKARRAGELESLPDLEPRSRNQVAIYPAHLQLPASHLLKIGEARRFGNLKVEPIRVTRGPAELVHYSGDRSRGNYRTAPVLKLWFRFTNESKDQSFAPIDHDLVFLRSDSGKVANNNFLMERARKPAGQPLVLTFDHTDSNHDFAGQNLGKALAPGESFDAYYLTTEEDFERLSGDLIWRVQLRKGLGPRGHGVTTLIEVAFSSTEIQSDGT